MRVLGLSAPRMTPGAIRLRFQQRFGHGLRVAWYRDVVRPRILRTPPITGTTDRTCEIHVLTSAGDWLNLIWTLKSFYAASHRHYALCIHGDKSLPDEAINALRTHFPQARIIPRADADAKVAEALKDFPRCLKFRKTNLLAPKIFDFIAYLDSDRMALFDSDLLFFAEPTEYLRRIEDPAYRKNAFNSDFGSAYTVTPEIVREHVKMELQSLVNSGLGVIQRDSIRFEWVEEFLALPGILTGHFWRIEQTVYALCSSRYGVELLPEDYTLYLEPGLNGRAFRHYNGIIRHLMYSEGIGELVRHNFLKG